MVHDPCISRHSIELKIEAHIRVVLLGAVVLDGTTDHGNGQAESRKGFAHTLVLDKRLALIAIHLTLPIHSRNFEMFRLRLRSALPFFAILCIFSWQAQTLYLPQRGGAAPTETGSQSPSDDLEALHQGNQNFLQEDPALLEDLALNGQRMCHNIRTGSYRTNEMTAGPPFLFLGCSDSRVSESTIFDARPGTFFTARNIANRYSSKDSSA